MKKRNPFVDVRDATGKLILEPKDLERFIRLQNRRGVKECWEWGGRLKVNGYGTFNFAKKHFYAHRLTYDIFVGKIPTGLYVLHKCDNPCCTNPRHLWIGTQQENMDDMVRKGRSTKGERSFVRRFPERLVRGEDREDAKLTESQVRQARALYAKGCQSFSRLGRLYGVSAATISSAIKGRTWSHLV